MGRTVIFVCMCVLFRLDLQIHLYVFGQTIEPIQSLGIRIVGVVTLARMPARRTALRASTAHDGCKAHSRGGECTKRRGGATFVPHNVAWCARAARKQRTLLFLSPPAPHILINLVRLNSTSLLVPRPPCPTSTSLSPAGGQLHVALPLSSNVPSFPKKNATQQRRAQSIERQKRAAPA